MKHKTDQAALPQISKLVEAYPEARALCAMVDDFAHRMKLRLIECWIAGSKGWDGEDPPNEDLRRRAQDNLKNNDFVDAAALTCLLWNRYEDAPMPF